MKYDYSDLLKILAESQEETANSIKDEIIGYINEYKPVVIAAAKELFDVYKSYVDNEDVHTYAAKNLMNTYQAYIAAGFTEDQAFILLLDSQVKLDVISKSISKLNNKD